MRPSWSEHLRRFQCVCGLLSERLLLSPNMRTPRLRAQGRSRCEVVPLLARGRHYNPDVHRRQSRSHGHHTRSQRNANSIASWCFGLARCYGDPHRVNMGLRSVFLPLGCTNGKVPKRDVVVEDQAASDQGENVHLQTLKVLVENFPRVHLHGRPRPPRAPSRLGEVGGHFATRRIPLRALAQRRSCRSIPEPRAQLWVQLRRRPRRLRRLS
mmetsp:Transcript_22068/g.46078  ORF Transcript_22068/g.46078 Transcript_22068/m.46078 type:complete len:212 (-) Transcript_22068:1221-1856(-)